MRSHALGISGLLMTSVASIIGCADVTAPRVVSRTADLTMAWDSTLEQSPKRPRKDTTVIVCPMVPDTTELVVDGQPYIEIVWWCW